MPDTTAHETDMAWLQRRAARALYRLRTTPAAPMDISYDMSAMDIGAAMMIDSYEIMWAVEEYGVCSIGDMWEVVEI